MKISTILLRPTEFNSITRRACPSGLPTHTIILLFAVHIVNLTPCCTDGCRHRVSYIFVGFFLTIYLYAFPTRTPVSVSLSSFKQRLFDEIKRLALVWFVKNKNAFHFFFFFSVSTGLLRAAVTEIYDVYLLSYTTRNGEGF